MDIMHGKFTCLQGLWCLAVTLIALQYSGIFVQSTCLTSCSEVRSLSCPDFNPGFLPGFLPNTGITLVLFESLCILCNSVNYFLPLTKAIRVATSPLGLLFYFTFTEKLIVLFFSSIFWLWKCQATAHLGESVILEWFDSTQKCFGKLRCVWHVSTSTFRVSLMLN